MLPAQAGRKAPCPRAIEENAGLGSPVARLAAPGHRDAAENAQLLALLHNILLIKSQCLKLCWEHKADCENKLLLLLGWRRLGGHIPG